MAPSTASRLVICGDDDWETKGNPGKEFGQRAAAAVAGLAILPDFHGIHDRKRKESDFNDVALGFGSKRGEATALPNEPGRWRRIDVMKKCANIDEERTKDAAEIVSLRVSLRKVSGFSAKPLILMVDTTGIEPVTPTMS